MYVYFSNRIEEKDNKIAKLKDKLNDIELLDDPSGEGKWLG
jgi:hypothetical protein